jgi:hypothetical protein
MSTSLFNEFLTSGDTLWVCKKNRRLFTSNKGALLPLLEYIDNYSPHREKVTILDRIMGNAAALLSIKAVAEEVFSPLGSELAANTLLNHGIKYHFTETVPYIQNRNKDDMCPMERLSLNKSPEELYEALRERTNGELKP